MFILLLDFYQVSTFFFLIFLVLYIFKIQILRYMYILKNNLHFGFFFLIFVISFIFWEKMNVQKSHEDSRESSYMFQFLLVIISHYCSTFVKIKLVIVKLQTLFRFYQFFFFFVLFLFQAPIQDTILHLVIHLQFPRFYDSSSIFPNFSYLNSIESAGQVFSRISVKLGLFDVFIIIIIILCFFFSRKNTTMVKCPSHHIISKFCTYYLHSITIDVNNLLSFDGVKS